MKRILIVIDMQNDYYPHGDMELEGILDAHTAVNLLISTFREQGNEVIFIQHVAQKSAAFFREHSFGAELHGELLREDGDIVFSKKYPNSFRDTGLDDYLKDMGVKNLTICGAMTHMCIDTTVRAGFDLGYDINLFADGCATKDLIYRNETIKASVVHKSFLTALNGTFCKVV